MTGLSNLVLYRRLGQQARPYWCQFLGILLLSLLSPPLALLAPLPLKIAVDNVVHSHPLPRFLDAWLPEALKQSPQSVLLFAVLLLVGVTVATELCDLSSQWLAAYTGEKLLRNFRAQLFRHVQRLSLSYHDTKGIADSVYRIQSDATSVQRILVESVVPSISSALTLAAMAYVTFRINWQLALVAMSVSPAIYLLSRAYRKRLRHQSREVKKLESSALSVIQEVLGATRVVKAFGQEDREDERFARKSNEGMGARLKLVLMERRFGLLVALLTALGTAAVLFVGIRNVLFSAMTLGDLLLVMGYVAKLNTPLKTIGKKMASMQSNLAGAERAFALLDEARDVVEPGLDLGHQAADVERPRRAGLEDRQPADVHVRGVRLELQEGGVEGVESFHGRKLRRRPRPSHRPAGTTCGGRCSPAGRVTSCTDSAPSD